jgi:hypothetical protein
MWKPTILATTLLIASGTSFAFAQNTAPAAPAPKKVLPNFEQAARGETTRYRIEQLSPSSNSLASSRLVDPVEWMQRRAQTIQENGGVPKND